MRGDFASTVASKSHGSTSSHDAQMDTITEAVAELALGKPLPPGCSRWDKTPLELRLHIVKLAGPLTCFLCGVYGDKTQLSKDVCQAIWTNAIRMRWQGDLQELPDVDFDAGRPSGKSAGVDMGLVKTRAMYHRLCSRFPALADKDMDYRLDLSINSYNVLETSISNSDSRRLRNIPMHNGWLDLVDYSCPLALGWSCILFGHAHLLRYLVLRFGVIVNQFDRYGNERAMDLAAGGGHVEILQMLYKAGSRSGSMKSIELAAANGHLDVVQWLDQYISKERTTRAINLAAENGHLHVVQWLHKAQYTGCTTDAMDWAAQAGHLAAVVWLHENRSEGCTKRAMDKAAQNGHLDVVKFLHENRTEGCSTYAMDSAAASGHLHIVKWLAANRDEGCSESAIKQAAWRGDMLLVSILCSTIKDPVVRQLVMDRAFL